MFTLAQAATQAGVSPAALRHAIRDGRLTATKAGRDWLVTRAELARYLTERQTWKGRGSMTATEIVALIEQRGPVSIISLLGSPGDLMRFSIEHGVNLAPWHVKPGQGMAVLWSDDATQPSILVVNADESHRAEYDAYVANAMVEHPGELPPIVVLHPFTAEDVPAFPRPDSDLPF